MSAESRRYVAPPPGRELEGGRVPTFSVIIPAYQAADTIGESVASALEQTRPPLEVIVCDDGSTDDLDGALSPYRQRITVLHKENGGAASARNYALRAASGEFVATLDSDDVFLPEYLEALGDLAAARPDLDLLSADVYFEVEGEIVGRFYSDNVFAVTQQRTAMFTGCFVGWPAVRRARLVAVGGFDESLRIAHDWDAWMRLILDGARAGLVAQPLLRYRLRPGSLTSNRLRSLRERVVLLEKTAHNPNLTHAEREAVESARRAAEARALVAEACDALLERRRGGRRSALALATRRGVHLPARAAGLVAAVAPRIGARLLARGPYAPSPLYDLPGG
jgi:hypothetical protein